MFDIAHYQFVDKQVANFLACIVLQQYWTFVIYGLFKILYKVLVLFTLITSC